MRRLLWLLLPLLFSTSASAVITAKGSASCSGSFSANQICSTSAISVAPGDIILAVNSTGQTTPDVTNTCGFPYSIAIQSNTTATRWVTIRYAIATSACSLVHQVTYNASFSAHTIVQVYGGVSGIGATATQATTGGTVANCSVSLGQSVAHTGNWVVGVFDWVGDQRATISGYREIIGVTSRGTLALADMQGVVGTTAVVQLTSQQGACNRAAVELVAGNSSVRPAIVEDQMQSILLASNGDKQYELPSAMLSPTWCTWMMPVGANAHTYEVTVQQGRDLNGQTNPIHVPSWQMTRICEDNSGNYWASPPLIAGSGITITPSATGTTISTGTGSAVTKIAGSTYTLPSGTAFPANSCTAVPSSGGVSAPGVVSTDVILLTRQSTASGWGNGSLIISAIPFSGTFNFEVCNNSANTITPGSALPMNWLVLR